MADAAQAPRDTDLRMKLPERRLFYAGGWHDPIDGAVVPTHDPSLGTVIADVAWAGPTDVERAIDAAEQGFEQWRRTTPLQRSRALVALAAKLREHGEELAWLDAVNAGMPIVEVERDVELAATAMEFFAGLTTEAKGETIPMGAGELNYTLRQPIGVVARIVAFNHPLMFAASRAAAPLAAGNAVILKPSEQAPLSALRLAELSRDILPEGVLGVLPGGRECGEALASSPRIGKVSLIGSVETGKAVLRSAAASIKEVALELGGKNALIAWPDADPEAVADAAFRGMNFSWCGQSCGSTSRIFLHEAIHDEVLRKLVERCSDLRPGLPTLRDTRMGALISQRHLEKVDGYVRRAAQVGAMIEAGGKRPEDGALSAGSFYEPTVLSGVTSDMEVAREEIFGPVVSVLRWSDVDTVIADANSTPYGLTASVWTNDISAAHDAAERLDVGYVWINRPGAHHHGAPFGGRRQSGIGREESIDELLAYTSVKNVNLRIRA